MAILDWSDVVSSGPSVEPLSVDDAKRNADIAGDSWDLDVQRWIKAARLKVENDARINLVNQTRVRNFDCVSTDVYIKLMGPLSSVSSIQYKDTADATQTFDASNYEVDTARNAVFLKATASWPSVGNPPNVLTVEYIAGYGASSSTVPASAIQAMHLLIKHWYENPSLAVEAQQHDVPHAYQSLIAMLYDGSYP